MDGYYIEDFQKMQLARQKFLEGVDTTFLCYETAGEITPKTQQKLEKFTRNFFLVYKHAHDGEIIEAKGKVEQMLGTKLVLEN